MCWGILWIYFWIVVVFYCFFCCLRSILVEMVWWKWCRNWGKISGNKKRILKVMFKRLRIWLEKLKEWWILLSLLIEGCKKCCIVSGIIWNSSVECWCSVCGSLEISIRLWNRRLLDSWMELLVCLVVVMMIVFG